MFSIKNFNKHLFRLKLNNLLSCCNKYSIICAEFHLPENQNPRINEIEYCKYFLLFQIVLLNPKIIILLGNTVEMPQKKNRMERSLWNTKEDDLEALSFCVPDLHLLKEIDPACCN